jgi:hypothetical protein
MIITERLLTGSSIRALTVVLWATSCPTSRSQAANLELFESAVFVRPPKCPRAAGSTGKRHVVDGWRLEPVMGIEYIADVQILAADQMVATDVECRV